MNRIQLQHITNRLTFGYNNTFRVALFVFFVLGSNLIGQTKSNPFELVPRIPEVMSDSVSQENRNPFDVVPPPENSFFETTPTLTNVSNEEVDAQKVFRRFLFVVFFLNIVIVGVLVTLFQGYLARMLDAFQGENMMAQLYRERETGVSLPFILLYIIFFLNLGIFIFLVAHYFKIPIYGSSNIQKLLLAITFPIIIYSIKHLFLSVVASVFPVTKQVRLYSFTINVFNIIVGLIIVPVNLFVAFGPTFTNPFFIYLGIGIVISVFLFRALRSLSIANRLVSLYLFHFLLYICTTEIGPLVILFKILKNQTLN